MKLYKHFNELGWDNVVVEEVEHFIADRAGRLLKENEYILPNIGNPQCLNSHCSKLTAEERTEHRKAAQNKYAENNVEKRKKKCRNYYYMKRYGMNEDDYFASKR